MIGGFFGALLPTTTATNPAQQRGGINTLNPTIAGGNTSTGTTRQNLMMDDLMSVSYTHLTLPTICSV